MINNDKLILVNNMKLGKRNKFFINAILTFLFMSFITIITINCLYSTSKIEKDDYFKLLLSDTYGDSFYFNIVEIINKNFNPLNVVELNEVSINTLNLYNSVYVSNPILYIYNENQYETYKEEYNVNPTIFLASYFLNNKLNEIGIDTIFEENDIKKFADNNNLSMESASKIFINDKLNTYETLKYIVNVGISNENNSVVKINDKKYAVIGLYANENNISLLNKLNTKLNEKYRGISKIYLEDKYNRFINIDFGGTNNSIKEVLNSIDAFSECFKEVI